MSYDINISGYNRNRQFARWQEVLPDEILLGFEYEIDDNKRDTPVFKYDLKNRIRYNKPTPWKQLPENYTVVPERTMFEVQSPVCPLRIHALSVPDFLSDTKFNTDGSQFMNRGGIHININRNNFTDRLSNNVFQFMHNTRYWDQFSLLSGRCNSSLLTWSRQHPKTIKNYTSVCMDKSLIITAHKAYAFELRLFKALPHLLLPALEWGDSLFMAADHVPAELNWDNWRKFVSDRKQYSNLEAYLTSKNL